jgi:predicted RNA methylase
MPHEAFAWLTRIKAVEREYSAVRLAMDRLERHARDNPHVLTGDLRFRDLDAASRQLDGTYLVRLFAEFETALRRFLKAERLRVPTKAEALVNRVRDKVRISDDDANKVHRVRDYRNTLVHDRLEPVTPVSLREATKALSTFLSWLQRTW